MADEIVVEEEKKVDYIQMIEDFKNKTVPIEKYNSVVRENKELVDKILNGGDGDPEEYEQMELDIESCKKDLFESFEHSSNLEIAEKVLKLREAMIDQGLPDPFLPIGKNVRVSEEDIKKANNVADVFEHCIDYAEGDSEAFTTELMRLTKDTGIQKTRKK